MTDFVGGALRSLGLLRALAGACCALPLLAVPGARAQRAAAAVLAHSATHAGPVWVKLGQWLATRPDLAPPALCARLAALQSARTTGCHALVHTAAALESLLHQVNQQVPEGNEDEDANADASQDRRCVLFERGTFPASPLDITHSSDALPLRPVPWSVPSDSSSSCAIEELGVEPLATGALAQVHSAVLVRGRGISSQREAVVVKVLHPGVAARLARDLALLQRGAAALVACVPGLRWCAVDAMAAQFRAALAPHGDLRAEHAHLARFRRHFGAPHWRRRVAFPRPCTAPRGRALAARAVLVEAREPGVLLRDALPALAPHDRRALAQLGARTFLKMALVDRFVHMDLHPGNILVRPRPHARAPVAVTVLDAGAATALGPAQCDKLAAQCRLVLRGRHADAADLMVTLAPPCTSTGTDPGPDGGARAEFVEQVGTVFREVMAHRARLAEVPVGALLRRVMGAARRAHVRLDPGFAGVISAAVVADGVARQLDPAVDVVTPAVRALGIAWLRARARSLFFWRD